MEGNFKLFISINIKPSIKYDYVIKEIKNTMNHNISISTSLYDNSYHISLIKSAKYLKHLEIGQFIKAMTTNMKNIKKFNIAISNEIIYLNNDNNTKRFYCLKIIKNKQISNLLMLINKTLKQFDIYEIDYNEFIPHLSLFSLSVNETNLLDIDDLNYKVNQNKFEVIKVIKVKYITVNIGDKTYPIYLD
jgi:hypothetical protein